MMGHLEALGVLVKRGAPWSSGAPQGLSSPSPRQAGCQRARSLKPEGPQQPARQVVKVLVR